MTIRRLIEELTQLVEADSDPSDEEKEIIKISNSLLSELEGVNDKTAFDPASFAKKIPGFSVWKVVASDENRDKFYGPVTGVDAVKHATPDVERQWTNIDRGGKGTIRHKSMEEKKADWALFRGPGGYYLRWRVLGEHQKEDKKPDLSVLWLFYLHKASGAGDGR